MKKFVIKKNVFFFGVSGLGAAFLIDYLHRNFGISREVYKSIAEPLFDFSLAFLFSSFFLFFVSDHIFRAWRNFAFVWIPISIIWITATPETTGMLQVINKESVGIISSGLFVLIGLVVVFFSWLGNGHKK